MSNDGARRGGVRERVRLSLRLKLLISDIIGGWRPETDKLGGFCRAGSSGSWRDGRVGVERELLAISVGACAACGPGA